MMVVKTLFSGSKFAVFHREDNSQVLFRKKGRITGEWFNIVKCMNDGLIYVNPRISREDAASLLWNEQYYSHPSFEKGPKSERYRIQRDIVKRCAELQGSSPGDRLLNLGCGAGHLLVAAKELGYEVFGVDTSPAACEIVSSQGLPVYNGEITDDYLLKMEGSFDVIAAVAVLEHLYHPKRYLKRISQLLRPGGLFFYSTLNAARLEREGPNWGSLSPETGGLQTDERIIYLFTPTVIRAYFDEIGLEILDPYEYPLTMGLVPLLRQPVRNVAKRILLRSRFLRFNVLRPYLTVRHTALMPMARKPLAQAGA